MTRNGAHALVVTIAALTGLLVVAGGIWSLSSPSSFAEFVNFPVHEHFLHDLGAFQIGAGVTLLLAVIWADALATALAGFLVTNTVHTIGHIGDADLGGSTSQTVLIGALSVLVAVALVLRVRQLGKVLGAVRAATAPELTPFVRQKTVLLTTYRRDGNPGSTPVSIAVDGDHAYVRSFERSLKTRRLRRNPAVEVAPSTTLGNAPGAATPATMRLLTGAEARRAAHVLTRKYPLLHGVVVPLSHRLMRRKTGRTVHFALTPAAK